VNFGITTFILTLIFRFVLSTSFTNKNNAVIVFSTITYTILMFAICYYFGKKEQEYLPINDTGFRTHLTSYIAHNLLSFLWFGFGFQSKNEKVEVVYITALVWGILLIIHFFKYRSIKKSNIKNLDKNELFE
jgi:uncharacterized membrane protein YeiB